MKMMMGITFCLNKGLVILCMAVLEWEMDEILKAEWGLILWLSLIHI